MVARPLGLSLGLSLGLFNGALAQQYRVDDSGGPLTLAEEVAEAAAAWNRAGEEVSLEEVAGAGALIRFGDPESMGPDLVSLTLQPEDGTLEVRLQPRLYRDYPAALLHELGLLVGLPAGGQGVMAPALATDGQAVLGEEETAALTDLRERVVGDLNGDGTVDLADLAALGRVYGQRGVNLAADLDGDGSVGAADLEILREAYRFEAPAAGDPGENPAAATDDAEGVGTSEQESAPDTATGDDENGQQDSEQDSEQNAEQDSVQSAEQDSDPGTDPDSEQGTGRED